MRIHVIKWRLEWGLLVESFLPPRKLTGGETPGFRLLTPISMTELIYSEWGQRRALSPLGGEVRAWMVKRSKMGVIWGPQLLNLGQGRCNYHLNKARRPSLFLRFKFWIGKFEMCWIQSMRCKKNHTHTHTQKGHSWRWVGGSESEAEDKRQLPAGGRRKSRQDFYRICDMKMVWRSPCTPCSTYF